MLHILLTNTNIPKQKPNAASCQDFFLKGKSTYLEMTLFINKICNRGPSSLELSTEIPLEQNR